MAQASFFYYNPESGNDSRQHDLFTPQPSAILRSSPMLPNDATMQHYYMPSIATPKPMSYRPSVLSQEPQVLSLDTEFQQFEDASYPRTPGLSAASSAISSPPQSNYLPTPTNGFFENLPGVKEGCEREVKSEILASIDWTRAGSPPLTPVFVHPPSVTASQASDLLSIASCPSLSPSPSPAPQSVISETENFCDPRNLLVSSKPALLINQLEIPTLPAFIPSNDDLLLGLNPAASSKPCDIPAPLDSLTPIFEGVSSFDSFSDLESENDFITDLSQDSTFYHGVKRQRLDSIPFSVSDEELSEASFEDDWGMSFAPAPVSADKGQKQSQPAAKKAKLEDENIDFETSMGFGSSLAGSSTEASTPAVSADPEEESSETPAASTSEGTAAQQTNRRGRKQSLTDDPSKTFVCTLCSRRFRRQEHLKRHYRSLHTHDKPFECTDCGKKFSRSDNLAQHARTHGNTTTIVGLNMPEVDDKTASMGAVLFETAIAAGSSSSSSGSDDEKSIKKRKRDE